MGRGGEGGGEGGDEGGGEGGRQRGGRRETKREGRGKRGEMQGKEFHVYGLSYLIHLECIGEGSIS